MGKAGRKCYMQWWGGLRLTVFIKYLLLTTPLRPALVSKHSSSYSPKKHLSRFLPGDYSFACSRLKGSTASALLLRYRLAPRRPGCWSPVTVGNRLGSSSYVMPRPEVIFLTLRWQRWVWFYSQPGPQAALALKPRSRPRSPAGTAAAPGPRSRPARPACLAAGRATGRGGGGAGSGRRGAPRVRQRPATADSLPARGLPPPAPSRFGVGRSAPQVRALESRGEQPTLRGGTATHTRRGARLPRAAEVLTGRSRSGGRPVLRSRAGPHGGSAFSARSFPVLALASPHPSRRGAARPGLAPWGGGGAAALRRRRGAAGVALLPPPPPPAAPARPSPRPPARRGPGGMPTQRDSSGNSTMSTPGGGGSGLGGDGAHQVRVKAYYKGWVRARGAGGDGRWVPGRRRGGGRCEERLSPAPGAERRGAARPGPAEGCGAGAALPCPALPGMWGAGPARPPVWGGCGHRLPSRGGMRCSRTAPALRRWLKSRTAGCLVRACGIAVLLSLPHR